MATAPKAPPGSLVPGPSRQSPSPSRWRPPAAARDSRDRSIRRRSLKFGRVGRTATRLGRRKGSLGWLRRPPI